MLPPIAGCEAGPGRRERLRYERQGWEREGDVGGRCRGMVGAGEWPVVPIAEFAVMAELVVDPPVVMPKPQVVSRLGNVVPMEFSDDM